jgi:anti-anti-sigma regulatory factor
MGGLTVSTAIDVNVSNGKMIVEGDVHWEDHAQFQEAIDKLVNSPAKSLVMDFSHVTFVFSSVIASLLTGAASAEAKGKQLQLIVPKSLDWLKRYISQNVSSRRFPGITLKEV